MFAVDHDVDVRISARPYRAHGSVSAALSLASVSAMLLVAGCAAQVTDLAQTSAATMQPNEILVAVDAVASNDPGKATATEQIEAGLQAELVKNLIASHVAAQPYVPGTVHPGADVLHVSVTEADPGNRLRRMIIGFGAGKATLHAAASLEDATAAGRDTLLAFDTSSNSGYKPGIVVPAAAAAGTGSAIGLAVGGSIDVATNVPNGLAKPVRHTAAAIVDRLSKYYAAVGWRWPAES